jgi:hypothetical protein
VTYLCLFLGTLGFGSLYCRAGFATLAWLAAALRLFAAVPMAGGLLGSRRGKTKSARGASE